MRIRLSSVTQLDIYDKKSASNFIQLDPMPLMVFFSGHKTIINDMLSLVEVDVESKWREFKRQTMSRTVLIFFSWQKQVFEERARKLLHPRFSSTKSHFLHLPSWIQDTRKSRNYYFSSSSSRTSDSFLLEYRSRTHSISHPTLFLLRYW